MTERLLIIDDYGEIVPLASQGIALFYFSKRGWDDSDLTEKRNTVLDLEPYRDLWPAWLVREAKEVLEQWKAEVVS